MKKILEELEKQESELGAWGKAEIWLYICCRDIYVFFRYDLLQGLKNFWRYKKVIWQHRWWDYSFADDVVEELYRERAENWHKNHYVGGEKDEKDLKFIVGLFEKMADEDGLTADGDNEDVIRKEIYRLIARKRYWD